MAALAGTPILKELYDTLLFVCAGGDEWEAALHTGAPAAAAVGPPLPPAVQPVALPLDSSASQPLRGPAADAEAQPAAEIESHSGAGTGEGHGGTEDSGATAQLAGAGDARGRDPAPGQGPALDCSGAELRRDPGGGSHTGEGLERGLGQGGMAVPLGRAAADANRAQAGGDDAQALPSPHGPAGLAHAEAMLSRGRELAAAMREAGHPGSEVGAQRRGKRVCARVHRQGLRGPDRSISQGMEGVLAGLDWTAGEGAEVAKGVVGYGVQQGTAGHQADVLGRMARFEHSRTRIRWSC